MIQAQGTAEQIAAPIGNQSIQNSSNQKKYPLMIFGKASQTSPHPTAKPHPDGRLRTNKLTASQQQLKPGLGFRAARAAPGDEFCYVDATVRGFTVIDPRLGFAEFLTDVPLGHPGVFSHGP